MIRLADIKAMESSYTRIGRTAKSINWGLTKAVKA